MTVRPSEIVCAMGALAFLAFAPASVGAQECAGRDGFPCADDGKPCTWDICQGGTCTHPLKEGWPCPSDGNACTEDVCNDGRCTHVAKNGWPCKIDDNPCTEDTCVGKECRAIPRDGWPCHADDNPCTEDKCVGTKCRGVPRDGWPCRFDHDPCTDDKCVGAECRPFPQTGPACADDSDSCTDDRCVGGQCTHDNPLTERLQKAAAQSPEDLVTACANLSTPASVDCLAPYCVEADCFGPGVHLLELQQAGGPGMVGYPLALFGATGPGRTPLVPVLSVGVHRAPMLLTRNTAGPVLWAVREATKLMEASPLFRSDLGNQKRVIDCLEALFSRQGWPLYWTPPAPPD